MTGRKWLIVASWLLGLAFETSAEITAVTSGNFEWNTAGWTNGVPSEDDTVFLNDESRVLVVQNRPAVAYGIRAGNTASTISTLQIEGASLKVDFLVLGDAAESNAHLFQLGGELLVRGTEGNGFELGNPYNVGEASCHTIATFANGKADLGHIRFNVRKNRRLRMVVFGSLPEIHGDSLSFGTADQTAWLAAELQFRMSAFGVAPVQIDGPVNLGSGVVFVIEVVGTEYEGDEKTFTLIEARSITGKPSDVVLTGLPEGAQVSIKDSNLVLELP